MSALHRVVRVLFKVQDVLMFSLSWLLDVAGATSHPFLPAWEIPSNDNDNFTSTELTSGDEFSFVEEKLHASLPNVTLLCVTRYEIGVWCDQVVVCERLSRLYAL